jgi:FdhE protein
VAEPLGFAAKLFRLQGRLAAAVSARHSEAPFSGAAADLPRLVDLLPPLLSFAAADGPPELAEAAEARAQDDAATAVARLRVYWDGEREAQDDYLARAFLRPFAEVLASAGVPAGRPRHEGHCPACGSAPIVSFRKELPESNGASRYLVCALCGTEWAFNRIRCPSCQEEDPVKLPGFQSDVHRNVRIEACETCRRYVKSIDLTLDARPLPEVDDLVSLAMDLWAIEEGWSRLEPGWAGI